MKQLRHFALALLLACSVAGCARVTPTIYESTVPGWSGNNQDSGIISVDANGAIITPAAQRAFNDLALRYGRMVVPHILPNLGSEWIPESGNYRVTLEMLSRWHELIQLRDRARVDGK